MSLESFMQSADEMGHRAVQAMGGWLDRMTEKLRGWDPQGGANAFSAVASAVKEKATSFISKSDSPEVAPPTQKVGRSAEIASQLTLGKDSTSIAMAPEKEVSLTQEQRMAAAMTQFKFGAPSYAPHNDNGMDLGNLSAPSFGTGYAIKQQQGQGLA